MDVIGRGEEGGEGGEEKRRRKEGKNKRIEEQEVEEGAHCNNSVSDSSDGDTAVAHLPCAAPYRGDSPPPDRPTERRQRRKK